MQQFIRLVYVAALPLPRETYKFTAPTRMGLFKLLTAVTVWLAMLIDYTAHGCRCAPLGTVCEYVQQAKVVLRGTVVSR